MGDDEYGDFEDVLDWIYVEDDYTLADELAESQIPDPGYTGTAGEVDVFDPDEYDVYDYWEDLKYDDDSYWEYAGAVGHKRKRKVEQSGESGGKKRRKLTLEETGGDNVHFVGMSVRCSLSKGKMPRTRKEKALALLPDWRERFSNDGEVFTAKEMPPEMKNAAEAEEHDASRDGTPAASDLEEGAEAGDEADGEEDLQAELASLDPEMLKAILREKLGDGMDESAFMQTISKMLSGEAGAEDAAGALADSLLNQATGGNNAALSGWLSQQGVSLEAEEDDNDDDVNDDNPPPQPPTHADQLTKVHGVQQSPSDSVIDTIKTTGASQTDLAAHSPSSTIKTKKRAAPLSEDLNHATNKKHRREMTINTATPAHEPNGDAVETKQIPADDPNPPTQPGAEYGDSTQRKVTGRNPRKRKGHSEPDEVESGVVKKQARKIAAPADAVARRTRSARAAAKGGK